MSTEEIKPVETVEAPETEKPTETEPVEKTDDEKSYEELKAEAVEAERQYKEARGNDKNDELRANMIARRDKALVKATQVMQKQEDINVRDLVTLSKADISEDSEEAKVLEKYKRGGIINNYAEGLNHPAIKAEFDAINAKNKTASVISENDSDEVRLRTTKDIVNAYKTSGEIPEDAKGKQAIVDSNLKEMGF